MKLTYLMKFSVILFLVVILSGCSNSNTEIKNSMNFYGATLSDLKRSFLSEMPFAARYQVYIYYSRGNYEKKGLKGLLHVEALEFGEVDNEFTGWRIPWYNPGNDRLEKVYSTKFVGECEAYTSNDNVIINCALNNSREGETLLEIVLPSDRLVDGYVNDSLLCVDLNTSGRHKLSSLRICNGDNHWREQMMELWEDYFNKEIPDTTRKKYLVIDTSGYILSND